jgi:hypothetical protein
MHTVQVTPIIGLPQFNGWSQVATNTSGSLVCVFSVAGLNAGNMGRDLVETITQTQVMTATELHTRVEGWINEIESKGCHLEIAAAVILGQAALFAAYQGQILLKRDQKVGTLLKAEADLKIIQGHSQVEDVYVLATEHSVSFLGEIQQKLMQGYDLDTIVTSVVPAMHGSSDSSLSSLGFGTIIDGPEPRFTEGLDLTNDANEASDADIQTPEPVVLAETTPVTPPPLNPSNFPSRPSGRARLTALTNRFSHLIQGVRALGSKVAALRHRPAKVSSPDVYVTGRSPRKLLQLLAVVGGIALVIAGGIWWWRRSQTLQVQAVEAAVAPLEQRISQAQSTVAANPVQSRDEMAQAIQEMEALAPQFQKQSAAKKQLQLHLDQARAAYQNVSGREELKELTVFYDFSLVESDFVATRADTDQKQAVFVDASKRQFIWLDLASKQVKKLSSFSKNSVRDLTLGDSKLLTLGNGLDRLDLTTDSAQFETVKDEGDSNREATLVGTFSQYVYAFNPGKRNIFRYSPEEDGKKYSDPIGWLKPGKALPYDQVNSWSIDGDIWMGTKDGKLLKFTSGEGGEFAPQGLPEPFTTSLIVFTRENVEHLYVLEPDAQRLVILRKTGEFIRQVKSPSLASATTLIVSEELKKALAISGSIIFEVPL